METEFINDAEIASQLSMSRSWVRSQRWRRRHGEDHVFTVDPVMVGTSPRYRTEEVKAWMDALDG